MKKFKLILLLCVILTSCSPSRIPSVLIIGDSISLGYTPYLMELLPGWPVGHVGFNAHSSREALGWIDNVKGWDIIHFNFGLWDEVPTETSDHAVPIEEYAENLRYIVTSLQATGAILIFATTTSVPESFGRNEAIRSYNEAALLVMADYNVKINDLYSIALERPELHRVDNVHFFFKKAIDG